jgi:hypothetical protein
MRARARVTVRRARQVRTLARLRSKRDLLGTHTPYPLRAFRPLVFKHIHPFFLLLWRPGRRTVTHRTPGPKPPSGIKHRTTTRRRARSEAPGP